MRYFLSFILLILLSVGVSASPDIVGYIGKSTGFSGQFSIVGGMGSVRTGCTPTGLIFNTPCNSMYLTTVIH